MEVRNMDVKEAVSLAIEHYKSLAGLLPINDLQLEETTISSKGNWLITVSTVETGYPLINKRNYKTLEIDSKTKKVIGMRIRNPFAEAS